MPTTARTRQRYRGRKNLELIALRVNAGLSREQLSYRTGISRETIRLVEDGWVPTPRVQFALANEFRRLPLDIWPLDTQKAAR